MNEPIRAIGLIDENFIAVYPTAAKYLGINKAVMMQQLHFLLNQTRQTENKRGDKAFHFIEGEWWVYNSYTDWQEDHFPWLTADYIGTLFNELEADGLVKSSFFEGKGIKKKWYTIDYVAWNQFVLSMGKKVNFPENPVSTSRKIPEVPEPISVQAEITTESKDKSIKNVSASETASPSVSEQKPVVSRRMRKPDAMFEAIATVWKTRASGTIVCYKAMMLGTAKRGAWKDCNFDTPATPEEILRFGEYAETRRKRESCAFPTVPETIQRWFYDMRTVEQKRAALPAPPSEPYTFTLTPDPEVNAARLRESVSL